MQRVRPVAYDPRVRSVLTPSEKARLDAESPVPVTTLMECAGAAVAVQAAAMGASYGSSVAVLVGPGNNGGDGYVAARHLTARGASVRLWSIGAPATDAARWAAGEAEAVGLSASPLSAPRRTPDLVIDAVFGGGFRHGIPDGLVPWIELDAPVLSVDVPTGLDPASGRVDGRAFTANRTVTFHSLGPGHLLGDGPDRCGAITVADIGLRGGDPALLLVEEGDAPRPERPRTSHKWSAGSVLVVGGGAGMVGAAVFAARSALHFGAGAVGVSSPSQSLVQSLAPEVLAYEAGVVPDRYRVLVVGPGLGDDRATVELAVATGRPTVIDADALRFVSGYRFEQPTVLTPHAGEFSAMAGEPPSPEAARRLAERTGAVVVLKGNPTVVTDGGVPRLVTTGGPELATIGTGDVLAGMIGALISRGVPALEAATSAAYWHGVAGADLARRGTVTADELARWVGRFAWSPE